MLAATIIVFREMLEMALVIGTLMAATSALPRSRHWIATGAALGACGAAVVALFMEQMESSFDGEGEFLFNAVVLALAAVLIGWTVIWMQRHGRELSTKMQQVGAAVDDGSTPVTALMLITLAAVMREGSEAVFFLFGAVQATAEDGWSVVAGALIGMILGGVVGWLVYRGLRHIPLQRIFATVSLLLILMAAGMSSQAVWNLVVIERLPALVDPLWDSSQLLAQESILGELLHALVGYEAQPSAMQMITFFIVLITLLLLMTRSRPVAAE
ncbi:MAG: FTR1 family protein [Mariprofundales bacterium]|nr:FTR1 family protein [Mariprofundales bacterium]